MKSVIGLIGVLVVALGACSTGDSMPAEFNGMASDEVGCTVSYGGDSLYVVGPLGPGDSESIEPNDYTLIRLGRTASDIVIATEVPGGGEHGSTPLNAIPADGVVALSPFRTGEDPGYVVTCWRGES